MAEVIDLSSHGIVALVRNASGKFLLLQESRKVMKGRWAPPHGRCEASDKSEEAGVIREAAEETGLAVKPIKKLLTQAADTKVKTVSFWLVTVVGGDVKIDASEAARHGWFSVDEILEMPLYPGTKTFFEKVRSGELPLVPS